ncbi:MAG: uridine kinase [Acidobacteriota bacterium]|nr:uridine kinase [Blastocatellia bacterium]MDW8412099.1 uridine kinase [Acidobacteriota bacterium]
MITVGIAGGSGSGKSTLARLLAKSINNCVLLQQDSYYKDFSECPHKINFDHPDSLDLDSLKLHLRLLAEGKPIEQPLYDFTTHRRLCSFRRIDPQPVVVLDGTLILTDPQICSFITLKIFIDTAADIRFIRRLRRDRAERGRSVESIVEQYLTQVKPMHELLVEPCKVIADIVVRNDDEKISSLERIATIVAAWIQQRLNT